MRKISPLKIRRYDGTQFSGAENWPFRRYVLPGGDSLSKLKTKAFLSGMERVQVGKNLTDGAISRVFYLAFHSIAYDLVNPRLSEWASRSVRVKQSQCFRTSIFIPTVLF